MEFSVAPINKNLFPVEFHIYFMLCSHVSHRRCFGCAHHLGCHIETHRNNMYNKKYQSWYNLCSIDEHKTASNRSKNPLIDIGDNKINKMLFRLIRLHLNRIIFFSRHKTISIPMKPYTRCSTFINSMAGQQQSDSWGFW